MLDVNKSLHIVVVGGSLAALFAATPLLKLPARHRVTILERAATPLLHDQGAGIVAGSEALAWLQRHDGSSRQGNVEKLSVLSRERLYLDREGNVIDQEESHQRMTSWDLVYHLGRWVFDGTWSKHTGNDIGEHRKDERASYVYGCNVQDLQDAGEKVLVSYVKHSSEDVQGTDTIEADFVVVADGPSSSMRQMLLGEGKGKREYAGYVAFRGTVCEAEISAAAEDVFVQKFTFFHGHDPNTQILAYTIPGPDGTLEKGKRLVNWVWYWNFEEKSLEYAELMTDADGNKHRFTLPTGGKMQQSVWERQVGFAQSYLPPQFIEIITKTEKPFVQAITDLTPPPSITPIGRLLNGKAVLVGDALAGFRPHTAASTSQAAFHGLLLEKVFRNQLTWEEYEHQALGFAVAWQQRGVTLGRRSQFGVHPLAAQARDGKEKVDRHDLWMRK